MPLFFERESPWGMPLIFGRESSAMSLKHKNKRKKTAAKLV
jgi:hypothetical protein